MVPQAAWVVPKQWLSSQTKQRILAMSPERQYRLITPRTEANPLTRSTVCSRTRVPMTSISVLVLRSACASSWRGSKAWTIEGTCVPGSANLDPELRIADQAAHWLKGEDWTRHRASSNHLQRGGMRQAMHTSHDRTSVVGGKS